MTILTAGTIEILDEKDNVIETWTLENTKDTNGNVMLYNQSNKGRYATEESGRIIIQELSPKLSPTGSYVIIEGAVVACSDKWRIK